MDLDQLAETTGASRRAVINVEQGAANPSVGILLRISDALGIGLPALVAPPDPAPISITRAGAEAVLWTGDLGGRGCLVAGTEPPEVLELWDWTLHPGDRHASSAHAQGTRELLHVLEGSVTVTVGVEVVGPGTGDALSFLGDLDHSYANENDIPARFSLSVFEPGVGPPPRKDTSHA